MKKGRKQMPLEERAVIEHSLAEGKSVCAIAETLGRSTSTISREIRKHLQKSTKGTEYSRNQCRNRQTCRLQDVCGRFEGCGHNCARCMVRNCNSYCQHFAPVECPERLARPAQVCNGCAKARKCHFIKYFYLCRPAHDEYRKTLVESRSGADIQAGELEYLDGIVSPGIFRGQSLHHIYVSNPGVFTRNERTLSRYLHDGLFEATRGDMKRACMVKPRKTRAKDCEHKVETSCRRGRTYRDYEAYLQASPGTAAVMMDLVIGRVGGKCLLTLHFQNPAFMIARLVDGKCAENTAAVFDALWNGLGPDMFRRLFPVVLTDNGTEFSNPSRLETAPDGGPRTRIFYCDPMNSNQKAKLERNHEFIRQILQKGTSFDRLTQKDVDLMMSHINSYRRPVLNDKTPYEVFGYLYGKKAAAALGITPVDPCRVCLRPRLLGIKEPMLIESLKK